MLDTGRSEYAISVVIPVRDGAHVIGRCLQALAETDAAGQEYEVIVVDNGSKDDTPAVVKAFAGRMNLRMLSVPGVPVSAVRNAGAAHARGVLLAFVDADCVVRKNWMRFALTYPWDQRSGAIGAFWTAASDATWVARVWCGFENPRRRGTVELLPAGNVVMPRRAFEAANGFDETLESNEDAEFCWRLRTMGLRVEAESGLEAVHLGARQTIRALYRREVWHGREVLAVFLRSGANARAVAFAFYTLFWSVAFVAAVGRWLWMGDVRFMALALAALIMAPTAIAMRSVLRRHEWRDLGPLVLLLAVYGVGRAVALISGLERAWQRHTRRGDTRSGGARSGRGKREPAKQYMGLRGDSRSE